MAQDQSLDYFDIAIIVVLGVLIAYLTLMTIYSFNFAKGVAISSTEGEILLWFSIILLFVVIIMMVVTILHLFRTMNAKKEKATSMQVRKPSKSDEYRPSGRTAPPERKALADVKFNKAGEEKEVEKKIADLSQVLNQ